MIGAQPMLTGNKTSRYDDNSRHFGTDMQNNQDMSITCPRLVDTSMTDFIFARPKWQTLSTFGIDLFNFC